MATKFDIPPDILAHVERKFVGVPGCHRFDHTERVLRNAVALAAEEGGVDDRVVQLGALLHDIARPEEMESNGKLCHAELGAQLAANLLRRYGVGDDALIEAVATCVRRHRFRKGEAPETIEEKIVFDADKLDSLGAVGIGRAFHFAGRIGAKLHNAEEDALNSDSYSEEDSAYREYLVKLRKIPDRVLTESGKRGAAERAVFMDDFFRRLNEETAMNQSNSR